MSFEDLVKRETVNDRECLLKISLYSEFLFAMFVDCCVK